MNEIEQALWARVYAAEYDRLAKRAAACFEPEQSSYRPSNKQDWQYGSSNSELERAATDAANRAVTLFKRGQSVFPVPVH